MNKTGAQNIEIGFDSPKKNKVGLYVKLLGLYFICLVLGALNIGAIGSLLKIIALLPIFVWLFNSHSTNYCNITKRTLFFVIWCVLSVIWSIDFMESVSRSITQITFLIMIISSASYKYTEVEIDYLKKCLVWSSRITAIVTLLFAQHLYGRIFLKGIIREDPNYLCAYFMFAIAYSFQRIIICNELKNKIASGCELIIYIYIILATGSRGGLLAVISMCSIIILLKNREEEKKYLWKRLVIIIFLFGGYYFTIGYLDSSTISRFSLEAIKESNGTGRYDLWSDALNAFGNSNLLRKIFGYGTGSTIEITYLFPFRDHNVIHNIFIENLIEIGITGLIIYIYHVITFWIDSIRIKDVYIFSILVGMLVLSLSTSIYAFKPYWNIMIFTTCVYVYKKIHQMKH